MSDFDCDPDSDFDFHNLLRLPVGPACLPASRQAGTHAGDRQTGGVKTPLSKIAGGDALGVKWAEKTTKALGISLQQGKFGVRPDLASP